MFSEMGELWHDFLLKEISEGWLQFETNLAVQEKCRLAINFLKSPIHLRCGNLCPNPCQPAVAKEVETSATFGYLRVQQPVTFFSNLTGNTASYTSASFGLNVA